MKVLFLVWAGDELIHVEIMNDVSNTDLNATARALLKCGGVDVCRFYLVWGEKLVFAGEEKR